MRPTPHFDKPDRLTVSGVHRGEQRALYDARRDTEIPAHGLRLVVVRPADLDADGRGRLRRSEKADLAALKKILATGSTGNTGDTGNAVNQYLVRRSMPTSPTGNCCGA